MAVIIDFGNSKNLEYFLSIEADHRFLICSPYNVKKIDDTRIICSPQLLVLLSNKHNKEILFSKHIYNYETKKDEYVPFTPYPSISCKSTLKNIHYHPNQILVQQLMIKQQYDKIKSLERDIELSNAILDNLLIQKYKDI